MMILVQFSYTDIKFPVCCRANIPFCSILVMCAGVCCWLAFLNFLPNQEIWCKFPLKCAMLGMKALLYLAVFIDKGDLHAVNAE